MNHTSASPEAPARAAGRRPDARTIVAAAIGGLAVAFALLNLHEVRVNWILGSWSTPLIAVIAVSLVLGAALDRLVIRRSARRVARR